jgi:hypothetical protein
MRCRGGGGGAKVEIVYRGSEINPEGWEKLDGTLSICCDHGFKYSLIKTNKTGLI